MALVPAPADDRPSVGVGMLGYGFMGKAHSNAFRTMPYVYWPDGPQVRLRALSGRTAPKVAEAATRYGFETHTTDWQDLLADPAVDVFDNVGPDAEHVGPTLAAVRAGKHVVCEKPLALSVAEATDLHSAAVEAGVKHLTCFNYRFVPAVRLAHDMIAGGEIGEVYGARFRYDQEWRTDPDAPLPTKAGALSVIGCHAIDQARYLVGEVDAVSAVLARPVSAPERGEPVDSFVSLAEFAGGATGTISASLVSPGRRNMLAWEINGSRGSLSWSLEDLNVLRHFRRGGPQPEGFADVIVCEADQPLVGPWWPSGHLLGWEHSHIIMLADFVRAVADGTDLAPGAATFADGAQAASVAEAITRSSDHGERVAVPLVTGAPARA